MHLLAAQPGAIDDGQEPVDPGQTPAEIIFISAADTELVCLSEARSALQENAPDIRLINMMHLKHPMSVDLHLDQCATKSKLVVARILGGTGFQNMVFLLLRCRGMTSQTMSFGDFQLLVGATGRLYLLIL